MNENAVAKATPSASQRFTDMVMREFTNSTGMVKISDHQRSLIQGYFIACDNALQEAEQKRQRDASGKGDFAKEAAARTPYTWENVNIGAKLAQKVVVYAKLGLDMTLPNNLFCIPRMNGKIGKYDLNFQEGYRGKEIKTKKYSYYPIKNIAYELVYKKDNFRPIKRGAKSCHDTYEFEITNPFDRGDLVGGFAYIEFHDPQRNILFIMSKADIEKRRKVSPSGGKGFWEKWYEEMALKTIVNAACNKVTLDPEKIDPDFRIMQLSENDAAEAELAEDLRQHANTEPINITPISQAIPQQTQAATQSAAKMEMPQPVPEPVPVYYSEPQQPLKTTDEPEQYDETPQELFGNEQPGF